MKHGLRQGFGIMAVALLALGAGSVVAQTTANGPYYANPSWDQTLPASTRFIVLSNFANAAVLDRETGLVWERSPFIADLDWLGAHSHCNHLIVGNRIGWRLPTLQELASLMDKSQSNPALPLGHPFQNVQLDISFSKYWSATTTAIDPGFAWWVEFAGVGFVDELNKAITAFAWCVRGGQGVDSQ